MVPTIPPTSPPIVSAVSTISGCRLRDLPTIRGWRRLPSTLLTMMVSAATASAEGSPSVTSATMAAKKPEKNGPTIGMKADRKHSTASGSASGTPIAHSPRPIRVASTVATMTMPRTYPPRTSAVRSPVSAMRARTPPWNQRSRKFHIRGPSFRKKNSMTSERIVPVRTLPAVPKLENRVETTACDESMDPAEDVRSESIWESIGTEGSVSTPSMSSTPWANCWDSVSHSAVTVAATAATMPETTTISATNTIAEPAQRGRPRRTRALTSGPTVVARIRATSAAMTASWTTIITQTRAAARTPRIRICAARPAARPIASRQTPPPASSCSGGCAGPGASECWCSTGSAAAMCEPPDDAPPRRGERSGSPVDAVPAGVGSLVIGFAFDRDLICRLHGGGTASGRV